MRTKSGGTVRGAAGALSVAAGLLCGGASALLGLCGPFTDVAADAFCPFVLEIFTLGITTGTTPTTYDPSGNVTRLQMAAFLSRTVDSALRRSSPRTIVDRLWTPRGALAGATTVGMNPVFPACDGADVWVPNFNSSTVSRVRGSDSRLLETWTGATGASGAVVAMDGVFVCGFSNPGALFRIRPNQSPGAVTAVATNLGSGSSGLVFDGGRFWTANYNVGSISIVVPGPSLPWTVTTVTTGFSNPIAALYDGANVWVADQTVGKLQRLDAAGAILQTVTIGAFVGIPVFDGVNIWAPTLGGASIQVVRAPSGAVLATLTTDGWPLAAAFDGQRVLVAATGTNQSPPHSVSLWNAADLTPLGTILLDSLRPNVACSDGLNFWVTFRDDPLLLKF
ncbi:MAG TPA: S-layer homology domain-containing protein [Thermoanaerobaculia bacterium]|nr:S-layer homology domain-containing protein [Thermoanaerobaculia bacterium]